MALRPHLSTAVALFGLVSASISERHSPVALKHERRLLKQRTHGMAPGPVTTPRVLRRSDTAALEAPVSALELRHRHIARLGRQVAAERVEDGVNASERLVGMGTEIVVVEPQMDHVASAQPLRLATQLLEL